MKKSSLPFIVIFVLLLAAILYFFGSPLSVVPGWHTTIYPPYYASVLIIILTLFFAALGYWLFLKRISKTNWLLFIIYFLVTTSAIVFLKFPSIFLDFQQDNQEAMFENLRTRILLLPFAYWALIITQILAIVYIGGIMMLRKMRARLS